ncbi:phosphatidylinositol 3-kinase [Saccharomycopsis crataegensis]|uniref:Phosphatidylinositol 3-kinase VPS34 n=1 Tax=Saccharomycopsis crataegensis TaxID=43959 RepID=A0AAV5QD38_9ASCO|nr:phosphatidylinositol 3-kinase [Saccharomycopsis crataegensis]
MDKGTVSASFALSSELDTTFKFKVLAIEGQFEKLVSQSARISNPKLYQCLSKIKYNSDLFIVAQLFNGNIPLSLPVQTKYVSFDYNQHLYRQEGLNNVGDSLGRGNGTSSKPEKNNGSLITDSVNTPYRRVFNQWIDMPINYNQLPLESKLQFKVYEYVNNEKVVFGQCSISLFDLLDGSLQRGHQLIRLDLNSQRFGMAIGSTDKEYETQLKELESAMKKMETLVNEEESSSTSNGGNDDWLNSMVIKKIEKLKKKVIKNNLNNFNLFIELVNFNVPIIYNDFIYTTRNYLAEENNNLLKTTNANDSILASKNNSMNNSVITEKKNNGVIRTSNQTNITNGLVVEQSIDIDSINDNAKFSTAVVYDPEQYNTQPIELKYHELERSLNNSNYKRLADKNLKPNLKLKKHLNKILNYSSIRQLNNREKNLIYKFKYYLINNFKLNSFSLNSSNFLNFLLKSINWERNSEIQEIQEILTNLTMNKLEISLTNTLELLGPIFNNNTLVRNFAVNNLKHFNDKELNLYLLQLIQALKFDDYIFENNNRGSSNNNDFSSIIDVGSKEELVSLYKSLKYNKNSGPINNSYSSFDNDLSSTNDSNEVNGIGNGENTTNHDDRYNLDENLSPLANFLIYKAIHNKYLGNYFYWYVKLESKDSENDFKEQLVFKKIIKVFKKHLKNLESYKQQQQQLESSQLVNNSTMNNKGRNGELDERLISRNNSVESDINELDSSEDISQARKTSEHNIDLQASGTGYYKTIKSGVHKIFDKSNKLMGQSSNDDNGGIELTGNELDLSLLQDQINFVNKISQLTMMIKNLKKSTPEKQQFLRSYLLKNEANYQYFDPNNTQPLTLPLNPKIKILYIIAEQCAVFKSSLSPLKLTFRVLKEESSKNDGNDNDNDDDDAVGDGDTYSFMYKIGDDLRQDQLIIQIIKMIAKLLKDENLKLKLNPYEILATGLNEGMIEFIPNLTVDKILTKYQNILNFFKTENPYGDFEGQNIGERESSDRMVKDVIKKDSLETSIAEAINTANNGPNNDNPNLQGIHPKIMDNFVKSCAGYCVITYLLGIGDRHLDNLLICQNGRFFHVDFGYILGKDPKPFPPLMKLPIEIIDGFGGLNSKHFQDFKNYCFICFLTLRKNSNLILNLLELMMFGNIPDLKVDGKNAILKVQEKFMLDLNDEEAIVYFQNLINDSVNAFLPVVIDKLHSLAQYWRA